ncbi:Hydrophobin 2 [Mycena sanguinolenta]|uniref:Hydrophobin n=1 Tax=Mycena sanguinolenta TaxID=230812 RepID=A0A8H7CPE3_9AGAR|nr:Hydrophobin 2 [Mycena sanguinolenta]
MFSKPSVIVTSVLITLAAALPHGYDSYPSPSVTTVYACMPPPSSAPISPSAPVSSAPISPLCAHLVRARLPLGAHFIRARLLRARLVRAHFIRACLLRACLLRARLVRAHFLRARLVHAPLPPRLPPPSAPTSSSTPTSTQCCNSVLSSTDSAVSAIAGLLGLDLTGLNVPIGLGCSPITVIGNNCGSTTVNCNAPREGMGLIAINCIPITL